MQTGNTGAIEFDEDCEVYKVYLKVFNERGYSQVEKNSRTTTSSPFAAEAAFRELISNTELIGKKAHVVMSLDNRQLNYHRFDRSPGEEDYIAPDGPIRLSHND